MAKKKSAPAFGPSQVSIEDVANDPKFIRFIKGSAVVAAQADETIPTSLGAALLTDLDEEDIAEAVKIALAEVPQAEQPEPARPDGEEVQGDPSLPPVTQQAGPGRRLFDNVLQLINNMDPAVKQAIVNVLFKFIGLKG